MQSDKNCKSEEKLKASFQSLSLQSPRTNNNNLHQIQKLSPKNKKRQEILRILDAVLQAPFHFVPENAGEVHESLVHNAGEDGDVVGAISIAAVVIDADRGREERQGDDEEERAGQSRHGDEN